LFENESLNLALEIDLFLKNGDRAMAVEVKANLKTGDVLFFLRFWGNANHDLALT
jgi:hypothetical protein